jgi:hypothetical protein
MFLSFPFAPGLLLSPGFFFGAAGLCCVSRKILKNRRSGVFLPRSSERRLLIVVLFFKMRLYKLRLFQNFSFGTATFKKRSFVEPSVRRL